MSAAAGLPPQKLIHEESGMVNGSSSAEAFAPPAFSQMLLEARQGATEPLGKLLQYYCNYLTILATTQLDRRLRRRMNPSDLVQETMLAAHRDFGDFRGQSERELLAWLRQILIHSLHRAIETHLKAGSAIFVAKFRLNK